MKNKEFFESRGASVLEVLLAMSIVAVATPFVYNQISKTTNDIKNITIAKKIVSTRNDVLNFVRMNQDSWPDEVQIQLDEKDLSVVSYTPVAGFVDKYKLKNTTMTDVYLAFAVSDSDLNANIISSNIGTDSAVVGDDGIAYGPTWAVSGPDFEPGDIIYKISWDFSGQDRSNYLHRGTTGEDDWNVMQCDLNMGGYDLLNVGTAVATSMAGRDISSRFVDVGDITSNTIYFSSGANLNGSDVKIDTIRALGDINGFRTMTTDVLNGNSYSNSGAILTDNAKITGTINVANNFTLKPTSSITVSGFSGISAGYVLTPYLSTTELSFYNNHGLTVSGELLQSDTAPLKIGNWTFPSVKPPVFTSIVLSRANIQPNPESGDFGAIMDRNWKQIEPKVK
ncbi:MAG: hypothetical protein ACLRFI_01625 [Alphaproteobacteria bacterium]